MTQCTVYCHQCRRDDNTGPRRWHWLCEDCAADCADRHRTETGHTDINIHVTAAPTLNDLTHNISQADVMIARRWHQGW
jgi:hypothetical protein